MSDGKTVEPMKVMTDAEYQVLKKTIEQWQGFYTEEVDKNIALKKELRTLIDKLARVETELLGKGDSETFKAAEWK